MSEDTTRNLPNDDIRLILARFDSVDSQLKTMNARLDGVEGRMTTLEDKVDKRLVETRPIWERALAEIAETRTEMHEGFEKLRAEMHEGFGQLRTEMHEEFGKVRVEMDDGLRRVKGQVEALNQNMLEMQGDMKYFDRRITKLEAEPAQ